MIHLGIAGASGRLGQRVLQQALQQKNFRVAGAYVSENSDHLNQDISAMVGGDYIDISFTAITENAFPQPVDVVVDFSLPSAFDELVDTCVLHQTPLVSGTTGLTAEQFDRLGQASKFIPVMWTSNFSINIQMIKNLLNIIRMKNDVQEIRIIETHHIHKQDMPSGTAISLAQELSLERTLKKTDEQVFQLGDVQIESIREGEVPGTHRIEIILPHEKLVIEHQALTPGLFAQGALQAAEWLADKPLGLYSLNDFLLQ
ncbi:4-hydroxy-tetrahydrodipicolinate reductase [Marinicella sp. W31]|uniref:4-hydroxy-tetrahydrodipicolinate reductase n=1 Tax=Marinicella sp. W31 TaxID=3023713 RepID=UPI003758184A